MLLIKCPWCGPRDEHEFRFGGESHLVRPGPYSEVSDETWTEYLHFRHNTKGVHQERWLHAFGCRRWFDITRSTVTHEIFPEAGGDTAIVPGPNVSGADR